MKPTRVIHRFVFGATVTALCCSLLVACKTEEAKKSSPSYTTTTTTQSVSSAPTQPAKATIVYEAPTKITPLEPAGSSATSGNLPSSETLQRVVDEAHQRFVNDNSGK